MSVYLGKDKVGIAYQEISEDILTQELKARLNDAVGWRVSDFKERNIEEMIESLREKYNRNYNLNLFDSYQQTTWARPSEWPDLDSLNLQMSGNDFIYMTYANQGDHSAIALHVEAVSGGTAITVTMGHITNGSYVVDQTITGTSNNYVRWFTTEDDDYTVVRVTGDIKYCYCYNVTKDGMTQNYRRQAILERIAYVPHLVAFCTSQSVNAWGQFMTEREVINNGDGNALTSMYFTWAYCRQLQILDISGLKTHKVTDFQSCFRQLYKITELDLRHLDVGKNKNFSNTFDTSRALRTLDLRGWNTQLVTNFSVMFSGCYSLQEIKGLEDFNTSNATTFSSMFTNCRSLKIIPIENWNTSKVTSFSACFSTCWSLQELDLSNWNPHLVTNFANMFNACHELKRINFDGWDQKGTGTITTVTSLFSGCYSLSQIDVSWLYLTSACTDVSYLFYNCWRVKELAIPTGWDLSGITDGNNRGHSIFGYCYSLEKITGISNWNFQFNNSMTNMFLNCYCLKSLDISNWDVSHATSLASFFQNCYSLKELDLSSWNPENCTTFNSMFSSCFSLTTVGNISNWDTSKITTMASMFRYCWSLVEFPSIQNWDFSKVTTIEAMFSECYALKQVTWKNVNLPACTSIAQIFRYDYNLEKADLSGWSIPVVTNSASYYHTFGDCHVLKDLIGFPIPAAYLNLGFQNCEMLSYESLLTIINALPQVSSTHTLRIPAISLNTLTAAEKAIATNKGWTLANS